MYLKSLIIILLIVALIFTDLYYYELVTSYSILGTINVASINSPVQLRVFPPLPVGGAILPLSVERDIGP